MNKARLNVGASNDTKKVPNTTQNLRKRPPPQQFSCPFRKRINLAKDHADFLPQATDLITNLRAKFHQYISVTDQGCTQGLKDFIDPQQILNWINVARTTPKKFASLVKDRMERTDSNNMVTWGGVKQKCFQGKPAYMQAIKYLETVEPTEPLQLSKCLSLAASDLVYDLIAFNSNSYKTSDGCDTTGRLMRRAGVTNLYVTEAQHFSSIHMGPDFAKQAVLSLIIDEGFPDRGRCKMLMSQNYSHVGAAMYKDPGKGYKCVVTFSIEDLKPAVTVGEDQVPIYKKPGTGGGKINFNQQKPNSNLQKPNPIPGAKQKIMKLRTRFHQYIRVTDQGCTEGLRDFINPQQIIKWINVVRTAPKKFVGLIKDRMERTDNQNMVTWGNVKQRCFQGKPAYLQAIKYLEKLEPIEPLELNKCLSLSASDLVYDCIASNSNTYTTSDGCETGERLTRRVGIPHLDVVETQQFCSVQMGPDFAKQAVLCMIIDEGLPDRGRCKIITDPRYRYAGAAMYKDPGKGYKCVITYCTQDVKAAVSVGEDQVPVYKSTGKINPNYQKPNYNNPEQKQRIKPRQRPKIQETQTEMKPPTYPQPATINYDDNPEIKKPRQRPAAKGIEQADYDLKNNKRFSQNLSQDYPGGNKSGVHKKTAYEDQDAELQKMWNNVNSRNVSNKSITVQSTPQKKTIVKESVKTKTVSINGLKKTQLTKTVQYSDGSSQKIVTTV